MPVTPQKDIDAGGKRRMVEKEPNGAGDDPVLDDADLKNLEEDQEEDLDAENESMLMISFEKDANGVRPKVAIPRQSILMAYVQAANQAGIEEVVPKNIGCKSQFGPYYIYGVACDLKKIVELKPTIDIIGPAPECKVHSLTVKLFDLDQGDSIHASALAKHSVHVIVNLKPGPEFKYVPIGKVKQAFKDAHFITFKVQRQKVKVGDEVTHVNTEAIHLNVIPTRATIATTKWPVLRIEVKNRGRIGHDRVFFPEYKICQHSELPDDDKFCRFKCHTLKPCHCDEMAKRKAQGGSPSVKKMKPSEAGTATILSKLMKSSAVCTHYAHGKCRAVRAGSVCMFVHDPTTAPGMIQCAGEIQDGRCPNGPKCLYRHVVERMAPE